MNLEELFETEKWAGYLIAVPRRDVNQSIDYLKTEVMEYVAGLQKRIAELKECLVARDTVVDEVRIACDKAGCMIGEKYSGFISSQAARIAELEAQVPKVVKPQILPVLDRKCECGAALDYAVNYCNNCGAKLVWRDA